jgi:hypothetical protein
MVLGLEVHPGLVLFGCTSLFTHQFQVKPCRCSRRVAAIIERIDLYCERNLMLVLIRSTEPLDDCSSEAQDFINTLNS